MTRSQAYEKVADEAEAMSVVARTPETRQAMKRLAQQWRELAEAERRWFEASRSGGRAGR